MADIVKSCSRCGLCAEVCPIFSIKKSETALARGKFLQLLGILRGELSYNKKIEKNIKLCLNCKKCTRNCPSEIDAVELFSKIKNERENHIIKFLNNEFIFNLKLLPLKIFNFFGAKPLKLNEGEIYFKGCIAGRKTKNFGFKCCAVPFLVSGRRDIYEKLVNHNLKIIENENVKKVFFNCTTCFDALKNYPFENPENVKKLELLNPAETMVEGKKFTFFKSCHLEEENFEKLESAFKDSVDYIPFSGNECCGFGGDFFIKHPIIAHKLSTKLAKKIYDSGVRIVMTACPTCVWRLNWGLFIVGLRRSYKIRVIGL